MAGPIKHWTSGHHDTGAYAGRPAAPGRKKGYVDRPSHDELNCGAGCSIEAVAAQMRYASKGFNPPLAAAYYPAADTDPLLLGAIILAGIKKL